MKKIFTVGLAALAFGIFFSTNANATISQNESLLMESGRLSCEQTSEARCNTVTETAEDGTKTVVGTSKGVLKMHY